MKKLREFNFCFHGATINDMLAFGTSNMRRRGVTEGMLK